MNYNNPLLEALDAYADKIPEALRPGLYRIAHAFTDNTMANTVTGSKDAMDDVVCTKFQLSMREKGAEASIASTNSV